MGSIFGKKVTKGEIQIAYLKARIHLEVMRDRKNQEIIKGQKELIAKFNAKSRSRLEQNLIIERVVNGLKYTQATNQLIFYCLAVKNQSSFLLQNAKNQQKLVTWLPAIYSLFYAADQWGLSSLNEFKTIMKSFKNQKVSDNYVAKELKQMMTSTPNFQEMNVYVLQMCNRNSIDLNFVNKVGHNFKNNVQENNFIQQGSFRDIQRQMAKIIKKNDDGKKPKAGGNGQAGNSFPAPKNYSNFQDHSRPNPYLGVSSLDHGPAYFEPKDLKVQKQQKPQQFTNFDNLIPNEKENNNIYPNVSQSSYRISTSSIGTPPENSSVIKGEEKKQKQKEPTMSQILKTLK